MKSILTLGLNRAAFLPNIKYGILCGAFSGATMFVLNDHQDSTTKRLIYLFPSIFIGYAGANLTAQIMENIIDKYLPSNTSISFPVELGAFVSAAIGVRLMIIALDLIYKKYIHWKAK